MIIKSFLFEIWSFILIQEHLTFDMEQHQSQTRFSPLAIVKLWINRLLGHYLITGCLIVSAFGGMFPVILATGSELAEESRNLRYEIPLDSIRVTDNSTGREVLSPDELLYELPAHVFSVRYQKSFYIPHDSDFVLARPKGRKLRNLSVAPNDSAWAVVAWNGAGFDLLLKKVSDPRLIVIGWHHHAESGSLFWSPDGKYLLIPLYGANSRSHFIIHEMTPLDSLPVRQVGRWSSQQGWHFANRVPVWNMDGNTVQVFLYQLGSGVQRQPGLIKRTSRMEDTMDLNFGGTEVIPKTKAKSTFDTFFEGLITEPREKTPEKDSGEKSSEKD